MSVFTNTASQPAHTHKRVGPELEFHVAQPSKLASYLHQQRWTKSIALHKAVGDVGLAWNQASASGSEGGHSARRYSTELFATLYGDATPLDNPAADPRVKRLHEALIATDEFAQLSEAVAGDADFSALATADLLASMAPQLQAAEAAAEREAATGGAGDGGATAEELLGMAARKAAKQAAKDGAETMRALAGLAPGMARANGEGGSDGSRMQLAELLRHDTFLRRVIAAAGRMVRGEGRESRRSYGAEEIVDIERGDDVSRLLPTELAMFSDPDLELLAYARLIERTALQYALTGTNRIGRGPMVVMLDCSGSMQGRPLEMAAAICMALAMVASKEKRAATVIPFNTEAKAPITLEAGGSPLQLAAMISQLGSVRASGGTSITEALIAGLRVQASQPRADMVMVTDDHVGKTRADVLDELRARKEADGLRVWGVRVNGGEISTGLSSVCEDVISLDGDDAEAAAVALLAGSAR